MLSCSRMASMPPAVASASWSMKLRNSNAPQFLGTAYDERTAGRRDYPNGFKTMLTRPSRSDLPGAASAFGRLLSESMEKGTRTDQAANLALAEMHVQGVSTRRGIDVLQCPASARTFHSQARGVRRAAANWGHGLRAWRERPLREVPYLFLDARYEKVRMEGRIVDCAVMPAVGIEASGKRRVLGCDVGTREAEVNWRSLLESLLARGLKGVKPIIADSDAILAAARRAVLRTVLWAVPWQRCQFHLQQKAGQFVTRQDARKTVAVRAARDPQ